MNRLNQIVEFAHTTAAPDESGPVGQVQVAPDDARTYDNTPVVQHFGFASALPIGSVTIRICAGGDTTKGVVIASVHKPSRPGDLQPGQTVLHDQAGSVVKLTNDGNILLIPASGKVIVQSDLQVTGQIRANGEITAQASGAAIPLSTHRHSGVQTGSGDSGPPIP